MADLFGGQCVLVVVGEGEHVRADFVVQPQVQLELTVDTFTRWQDEQFVFTATDARDNAGTSVNPNQLEIYNTEHPNAPGIPVNLRATTLAGGHITGCFFRDLERAMRVRTRAGRLASAS